MVQSQKTDSEEMSMYFIDQRIQVICNQLGNFRFRACVSLPVWEYKKGQFFRA